MLRIVKTVVIFAYTRRTQPLGGAITMNHRKHKVLGNYCWDCKVRTSNAVPGFDKSSHSDGPRVDYIKGAVVWADGTRDMRDSGGGSERLNCSMCKSSDCHYPVHEEKYRVVSTGLAKAWDKFNPVI